MGARKKHFWVTGLKRVASWALTLALLAGTVGGLALWNLPALRDWHTARQRLDATHALLDRQRGVVERLEAEKEALAADRRALERAAREEYLLIRPGEEVYVFQERRTAR